MNAALKVDVKDGGPAFPLITDTVYGGASLLAYFMAHAPSEPQEWFVAKMPDCPKTDRHEQVTPEMINDYHDWQKENRKQRYLQWPRAWAEEMLKQLGER